MITHLDLADHALDAYDKHTIRLKNDLEVLVERKGHSVVIAIRGSEVNAVDWVANFLIFPWRSRHIGWAPYGFLRRAQRVVHYLMRVENLSNYPYVYLTGHSAGAAIALLAGEILTARGVQVHETVGFAAPCTGKRKLRVPTTLYDHSGDPVCKVPHLWGQPVELEVLPDVSEGPTQHSMLHYYAAVRSISTGVRNGSDSTAMSSDL